MVPQATLLGCFAANFASEFEMRIRERPAFAADRAGQFNSRLWSCASHGPL